MKSRQIDFSRVPNGSDVMSTRVGNETVSVDTSYISDATYAYYETAARIDKGKFVQRYLWQVLEQYSSRDAALAGHHRWAKKIRQESLIETDDTG